MPRGILAFVRGEFEGAGRNGCPCGDLPTEGRCDGDIRESCRRGQISAYSCASRGSRCGWDDADQQYGCVDHPVCRLQDQVGRCDGEVAINCEEGRTTRDICTLDDGQCETSDQGAVCAYPETGTDAGTTHDAGPGETANEEGCGCRSTAFPCSWIGSLLLLALASRRVRRMGVFRARFTT